MNISRHFKAYVTEETATGLSGSVKNLSTDDLPEGDVLIRVYYSSLNYKDALSATGNKGVTKNYPHIPGCDAAGEIIESNSPELPEGLEVIVTGYDLGMNTFGGFSQYIRVPADWVVPKPKNLTLKESMMLGTAGFTAGLALYKLQLNNQTPEQGKVIVTGATGGVGGIAIQMLSKTGYDVIAATRKTAQNAYLKNLGASEIIDATELTTSSKPPLQKQQWAGGIDTAGGEILVNLLKKCNLHGNIITCGNAYSADLNMTVLPFILRGINLLGVTASNTPMPLRQHIWQQLSGPLKPDQLTSICKTIHLEDLSDNIQEMLNGNITGRVLVSCE